MIQSQPVSKYQRYIMSNIKMSEKHNVIQLGEIEADLYLRNPRGRIFAVVFSLLPSSHRRHGQDKTVLSCPRLRCEM